MYSLTQKRLKECINYDHKTGTFRWINPNSNRTPIGGIAGYIASPSGYRKIGVDGKLYLASRLAFLYMEGYFPEYYCDHIDRDRGNDRWSNLRHVSSLCNSRNCVVGKNNNSGITGVSWTKERCKWRAQITANGKNFNLGYYKSKKDAATARWEAEQKYNFPDCNTTSSAYLYLKKLKEMK